MTTNDVVALLHLVGFTTGIVLYAMLGVMTVRAERSAVGAPSERDARVPIAAAALGLIWNIGALVVYGLRDFGLGRPNPLFVALAFTALGLLPAVVVHSAVRARGLGRLGAVLVVSAYAVSGVGGALHVWAAGHGGPPSRAGLLTLTIGYGTILLALVALTVGDRQVRRDWRRALSVVALAAFAVSALHLSHDASAGDLARPDSWPAALLGHHASLPLALVILYQSYRFAFVDLFLRRALLLLALVAVALLLQVGLSEPLAANGGVGSARLTMVIRVAALIVMALAYPLLRRGVFRFVDRVVLERADYRELRRRIAAAVESALTVDDVMERTCAALAPALTARRVTWRLDGGPRAAAEPAVVIAAGMALVRVSTADAPAVVLEVGELSGGRRLFSDDIALLESVAATAARRIDVVRVTHERYARDLREREMRQLATESELRALRAQLHPHFLFNALTTIGYLIQTSPSRAQATLYRLTDLLRAVLRRSVAEWVTLGEEIEIVEAYLAIERARFEERLEVAIDVPAELRGMRVPPLLLQPLVENAVKHGVSPLKRGGRVSIGARVESDASSAARLHVWVSDTGVGIDASGESWRRAGGVGLANVERRLARHFDGAASLRVSGAPGAGTTVDLLVPAVA